MPKSPPFEFVLEYLARLDPVVKPMFGCHAIYIGERIVLMLRANREPEEDNGVWVATAPEYHASLLKELPSLRTITLFGADITAWQVIPEDSDNFEQEATHACELILHGDPRIGKIPKKKAGKKK